MRERSGTDELIDDDEARKRKKKPEPAKNQGGVFLLPPLTSHHIRTPHPLTSKRRADLSEKNVKFGWARFRGRDRKRNI